MFAIVKDMDLLDRAQIKAQLAEDRMAIKEGFQESLVGAGRAERERLRWILKADRAELWRSEGARNMAQFLSGQAHISNWKARRMIEAAYALESLPLTAAALESGALSLDKVVELARFVTPADESRWISWARRRTTGGVRDRADTEVKRARDEAEHPEATRSLDYWRERDHVFIQARLPSDEGERVISAIDKLAEKLPAHPDDAARAELFGGDEPPSIDQRRADALVALVTSSGAGTSDTTVVVHASLAALTEDLGSATVSGRPAIHPETARRLCCDSKIRTVLEDGVGTVGIGSTSRVVPAWLRAEVLERDGHRCTFSGCEIRDHLHMHHVVHWVRGGLTELDNLITLCTFHHKLIHEFGWSVTLDHQQRPIWFRPSSRVYEPGPPPPTEVPEPKKDPPRLAEAIGYSRMFALAAVLH